MQGYACKRKMPSGDNSTLIELAYRRARIVSQWAISLTPTGVGL